MHQDTLAVFASCNSTRHIISNSSSFFCKVECFTSSFILVKQPMCRRRRVGRCTRNPGGWATYSAVHQGPSDCQTVKPADLCALLSHVTTRGLGASCFMQHPLVLLQCLHIIGRNILASRCNFKPRASAKWLPPALHRPRHKVPFCMTLGTCTNVCSINPRGSLHAANIAQYAQPSFTLFSTSLGSMQVAAFLRILSMINSDNRVNLGLLVYAHRFPPVCR